MKKIFITYSIVLSILLISIADMYAAVVSSTATGGNWSSTSTWQGGAVPGGSDVVIISTTGGSSVVVDVNTASIQSLTINSGAIITCNSNVTLTVGKGAGLDLVNNGTIIFTNGTLKLGNNSTWDGTGNWYLYTINLGGRNLTLSFSTFDTIHIAGSTNPITNGGSLSPGTNSIFDFNGTSSQDFPLDNNISFNDVQFSNTSGVSLTRNISTTSVSGNVIVNSGSLSMSGFTITGNPEKSFIMNTSAILNCNMSFPSGFSTYALDVTSDVIYNASGSQTISSTPQYGNLQLASSGTKTAGGALTVNGNFQLSGSAVFSSGTSLTHTFKGNWTNNSTANPSFSYTTSSTIIFSTPGTPAATLLSGTTPAATSFYNVTVSNTSGFTSYRSCNVAGTLTISSSVILTPSDSITIGGAGGMTVNGTIKITKNSSNLVGQFTMSGTKTLTVGTVDFSGNSQSVDNLSYKNLTVSGSATLPSTFSVVPSGTFSISGTATFGANQTIAFGGNTTVSGSGILDLSTYSFSQSGKSLTLSSGGSLKIAGTNGLPTFGTYSLTGGTVEFYGTTQSVAAQTYGNLTISGSRSTSNVTLASGTINISGTFNPSATFTSGNYVTSGNTVNFNSSSAQTIPVFNYNHLTSSSTGARTLAPSGTIGIKGNFTTGTNSFTTTGSTVDFNGGGSQTIPAFNFYNLTSSNSGDRTLASSGNIGVAGVFTAGTNFYSSAGSTIDFNSSGAQTVPSFSYFNLTSSNSGARTLDNTGTIYVEETFTPGSNSYSVNGSTVEYMGTAAQTIAGFSYNNLTIAGNGTKTIDGNTSISGTLTLNNDLSTTMYVLAMGGASVTTGLSEVTGTVRRTSFVIGTEYSFGNQYTSITFASGTLPSQLDVTINSGIAPSGKTDAILRSYDITTTGGSSFSSTLRLHYLDGELNGNTSTQLALWRNSGSWSDRGRTGNVNTADKWVELSDVTSFSEWTLANASLHHFSIAFSSPQTNGVTYTNTNTITAKDQNENTLTIFDASANTVSLSVTPSDGTIYGLGAQSDNILNQAADFMNGIADVTAKLFFIGTTGDHVFTATSANGKTGTSANINIQVGTPVRLAFSIEPGNAIADSNLSVQPIVSIQDTGGNIVSSATDAVALSIGTNPGSGTLSATSNPINASFGNAAFTGIKINRAGTGYTLNATAAGLTSTTSSGFTINNPMPATTSISPTNKVLGDIAFTITVNGTHFVSSSVIQFDGSNRATTFVNDNQLTAQILADDLLSSGAHSIAVFNPTPGGGTSNTQTFTVLTGSISGLNFNDANGNGVQNAGESGLQNWLIRLSKNGSDFDSTFTDADGNYSFVNLSVGTYIVSEFVQGGWLQTLPSSPSTYTITIQSGQNEIVTGNNFGSFQYGSISGVKFHDLNGNGTKDIGEGGLQNWKIKLAGSMVDSFLSDVNGNYSFINLIAGNYTVSEVLQSGWTQTLPANNGNYSLTISTGKNYTGKDFGNFQLGIISGQKFHDFNGNGTKDVGETGIQNWKMKITGTATDSQQTDASGNYSFINLGPGNYTVSEESQSGWLQTVPLFPATYSFTIISGSNFSGYDFGNFQYRTITGMSFNDVNGNGIKDGGESGLQNWRIRLSGAKTDSALTDANGNYAFTQLIAGNYTIVEDAQNGWLQTLPVSSAYYTLTIPSDASYSDKDFGNFLLGIISGQQYNDVNANGIKDIDENGIQNWKIKLSGAKTDSVLTDANGTYSFAGLLVGAYTVSEVLQSGWIQTAPVTPGTFSFAVVSGSNFSGNAFGNFQLGSISGMKFKDVNGNGVKDNGELGLQNWKIKLSGTKTDSVLTDANGNYSFGSLQVGNYSVSEVVQSGWLQTLPVGGTYPVDVTSGSAFTAKDFGNFQYGAISGTKFNDVNGNGVKENGENGLQNWEIKLSGAKTDSVFTDANGNYSFANLSFGDYIVSEVNQNGWLQTLPSTPSTYTLSIVSGSIYATKDFGNFKLGTISGMKYNDNNGNGQRDNGENGLINWKIKLSGAKMDSTLTDESGNYSFSNLMSGDYVVSEQQQSGWMQTMPSTPGTYSLTIVSGSTLSGKDFGNLQLSTISGVIFLDQDGDGVKDNGEVGIAGWKIRLTGNKIDSVFSDANGAYIFNSIQAGNYVVSEVIQAGWVQTLPANNATYPITLTPGLNETGKDFGNSQLGSVSGMVFNDMNGNGMIEDGENGFQGWKIKITGTKNDSVTTSANGSYTFAGIPVGTYSVSSVAQSGYTLTVPVSPGTYSPIVIESGTNVSGLNFGYFGGATKFRTYRATTDLSFKGTKLKFKNKILTSGLPNLATTVENVFKKIGKSGATFLGVKQIEKILAKKYGWIAYKKAADLAKLYTSGHNSTAFPIDYLRIPGKPDKKLVKAITANRTFYNNIAFEQGVLFKLNIIASDTFVTPYGFGNLLLDTSYSLFGRQLQGMTLQKISVYFDTLMTYWESNNILSNTEYSLIGDFVTRILKPINERFSVTFDTSNYIIDSNDVIVKKNAYGVRLLGYKTAAEAGMVRQIPGIKNPPMFGENIIENDIPTQFALYQNFPNPFNPVTTIKVDIPEQSVVSLKIYDIIGRETCTLADNEVYEEGAYEFIFSAVNISSGIYFYKVNINQGEFTQTKKLILIK